MRGQSMQAPDPDIEEFIIGRAFARPERFLVDASLIYPASLRFRDHGGEFGPIPGVVR
jgi:hypothetical protein